MILARSGPDLELGKLLEDSYKSYPCGLTPASKTPQHTETQHVGTANALELGATSQHAHDKLSNKTNWCEIHRVLLNKERWKVLHLHRHNQLTGKTEDRVQLANGKEMRFQ